MTEISLIVDGIVFKANKDALCKHSDYFRAMFSGNYVESDKHEISIQVIDPESMKIILDYINTGSNILRECDITCVETLETAARFLLMTEFVKQIEYYLLSREIISIAHDPLSVKPRDTQVEHGSSKYGLVPFNSMKLEYIPDITRLCWYLSHPFIDATNELDIFMFGYNWISQNKTGDDAREALLMILGCLDLKKLTFMNLIDIKTYMKSYKNSMAAKVVKYIFLLACEPKYDLSLDFITSTKIECEETVYDETLKLVEGSKSRNHYTPVVTLSKVDKLEIYILTEKGLEIWQELPGFLQVGHVVSWGLVKLVMVKETTKSIWVYDVFEKEWTCHGEGLWNGFHHGACIVGDLLFIIKFSQESREFLSDIYNLRTRVFLKEPKTDFMCRLENGLLSLCVHEGAIYTAIDGDVYKRDDLESADRWSKVDIRGTIHRMVSFNGYIYCTMDGIPSMYRFRPGVDSRLRVEARLLQTLVQICNMGDRILFVCSYEYGGFTRGTRVLDYHGKVDETLRHLYKNRYMEGDNIMSCCPLVIDIPLHAEMSNYVKERLEKYEN